MATADSTSSKKLLLKTKNINFNSLTKFSATGSSSNRKLNLITTNTNVSTNEMKNLNSMSTRTADQALGDKYKSARIKLSCKTANGVNIT